MRRESDSKAFALLKADAYRAECERFERKYGLSLDDFATRLRAEQGHEDFEKEDDFDDWMFAAVALRWWEATTVVTQGAQTGEDDDLLTGLTRAQLEDLARLRLGAGEQARLHELLDKGQRNELREDETAELDQMIDFLDELNILKARAMLTLQQTREDKETDQ